jgi:hypothetical protein
MTLKPKRDKSAKGFETRRKLREKGKHKKQRKRKLRCPKCFSFVEHDKIFDVYDCPAGCINLPRQHGFNYEDLITPDFKSVEII